MIWDTFLFYDELDMLECRLTELDDVVDRFVLVEGDKTNRGEPKPAYYLDNAERFAQWSKKIVHVWATDLPPEGWDVEYAKREWIRHGLEGAADDDIVLLSDVDEIPHPEAIRHLKVEPEQFVRFHHRLYCFTVDWLHPYHWVGTIAARSDTIWKFQVMRDLRHPGNERLPQVTDHPGADSWHFTWVGGTEQNYRKLESSHDPEGQRAEIEAGLADGRFVREGVYIGDIKLTAVEVDETWPRYISERRCPPEWFRATHE